MKKALVLLLLMGFAAAGYCQKVAVDPTISPSLFRYNDEITVTYDVTGTSLASLTSAYAWVWIPGENVDAKYNVNPASGDPTKTNNAKFTKSTADGKTLFTLTFTPEEFFASDISGAETLGILLKGNDWSNGQTTDYLADFWDGSFQVNIVQPAQQPLFVENGDVVDIVAEAPVAANFSLYINGNLTDTENSVSQYTYSHTVTETSGGATVRIVAVSGANTSEETFQYLIAAPSPLAARPSGVIPGINYYDDDSKVTLCLWAPGKESVYALGDFSEWMVLPENIMKRDGEYFWITFSDVSPGEEYGFQYLVDESIFVADPYADKILDPDDQYIPAAVYPDLKPFPQEALKADWYFNRVAVFQTGQAEYSWVVDDFEKPAKEKLVVYELLIRDFFGNGERTYENLIDTISYFKRLGVTAIELMPVMEFNGNESWGYNPAFMFAPDKYYGPKDKLKEFVDVCHQNGIAVILDIALNHQDMPNTYVMLDFDFGAGRPQADNRWFNQTARHPFNVFFDMNHESSYTKAYIDTINHYWLNEYKVDGFRFDLSKGFTQTNNPNNVEAWSAYDASRIALLKRMADEIWSHTPDAYVILEHLSVNTEEKELAEYRADEGKGMMLWGNMNHAYNQATMGYSENSNISGVSHESRGWDYPHLVSYMESHDEERLMVKNIMYGSISGTYSVKDTITSLSRIRAANVVFYTVPGPKMLWQFGELGYDYSINHCLDGTINNDCRISNKPVRWDYRNDYDRYLLYQHTAELLHLRSQYDVFTDGDATIAPDNDLIKKVRIRNNPYTETPASADEMNALAFANFDVVEREVSIGFPHPGAWFDFYGGGEEITVTGTNHSFTLAPGDYKLFTDFPITPSAIVATEENLQAAMYVYPNPVRNTFMVTKSERVRAIGAISAMGSRVALEKLSATEWDASSLPSGFYILDITTDKGVVRTKIFKF